MGAPRAVEPPFIVTVDVGSSSVRALCFDARGRALPVEHQQDYEPETTPDGGVEFDPERLVRLTGETLDGVVADLGPRADGVAAVAISTFWHTVLGVGADGRARTALYSWADTRSAESVGVLRARLDEKTYHARTGCVFHTSYLPARILWRATVDPAGFAAVRRWMSFGEYLQLRLFGETRCSISMASGSGLFDQHALRWDGPVLEAIGLTPDHLAPLTDLDAPLSGLRPPFAGRWPALARRPWLPALGDGACSNIGAGCHGPDRVALMVGTSGAMRVCWETGAVTPPAGLWCYRVDRRRILLGGALSNGGSVYHWLRETLQLGSPDAIEREIAAMPPDGHGLTVLPFLAGERSTGWVATARAAVVGLSLATQPIEILRAGLETVAYRFALIHARLAEACPRGAEIVATGGALLASPAWTQIMADVLGVPLRSSTEAEASSRGAALLALEALGALPSLEAAPAGFGPTVRPDPARHAHYRQGLARHRRLYDLLIPFYEERSSG
ncbi:MAG TPA: gluconokinase [Methylomirabilota bacterium]|jgi:gluconokinase|nr:gluconokinase [Methylomirabilota bacterium]HEV8672455.1 gluconokinase [Methylomirabilota bacterium]